VRRLGMIALSLGLTLSLAAAGQLLAQDAKKADAKPDAKPADVKKDDAKPADAKPEAKADEKKAAEPAPAPAPKPPVEEPLKPIPPEVVAKQEAALRAVAELIVAAQEAGLVDTTIDPPPIMDILVTARATDKKALKAQKGVSPEVFGGWFTGYAPPLEGVTAQADVRIVQPSQGLKELYEMRAGVMNRHIEAVKKARAAAKPAETKAEAKPAETKPAEKKAEAKPAEKKAEAKPADTPKAEAKPAEAKKDEKK
jgi:hypothetical protein